MPVRPAVLPNYVRELDGCIFWSPAVEAVVTIVSHDEQFTWRNCPGRKRYQRWWVVTCSGREIRLIKLFPVAEDLAMVATDGFARHCQDALQNDGIVAPQCDDISVMQDGAGLIRLINNDPVSGTEQWEHRFTCYTIWMIGHTAAGQEK